MNTRTGQLTLGDIGRSDIGQSPRKLTLEQMPLLMVLWLWMAEHVR